MITQVTLRNLCRLELAVECISLIAACAWLPHGGNQAEFNHLIEVAFVDNPSLKKESYLRSIKNNLVC